MADVFKAGDVVRLKTGEGPTMCVWSEEIPADGAGSCCWFDRGDGGWTLKRGFPGLVAAARGGCSLVGGAFGAPGHRG